MSLPLRCVLGGLLLSTLTLPLVTGHSLFNHVMGISTLGPAVVLHPESLFLIALTVISSTPALRLGSGIVRVSRRSTELRSMTETSTDGQLRDVPFRRLPLDRVSLFAAGMVRPQIYVTEGAVAALDESLLYAALLHERAHLVGRHPRWLVLNSVLRYTYGRVPYAGAFFDAVELECERQADWSAVAAGAQRSDLFEAIVRVAASDHPTAALATVDVEQRLRWLAEGYAPPTQIPLTAMAGTTLSLSLIPLGAHLLLWMGVISGVSFHHTL